MFKKIVVVGPEHPDTLPKSVLETLREMGYSAEPVDERELFGFSFKKGMEKGGRLGLWTKTKKAAIETFIKASPKFEARVYGRLAKTVQKYKPDLVIFHSAWIPPQTIGWLKKNTNAKIICWFPDHPGNIGRQYIFAAPYDCVFFKDRWLVERARLLGKNAHYLPEACMPKWHKRVPLTEKEQETYGCDITIAGNMYYYRAMIFEELVKKYKVKLWGSFPRWVDSPAKKAFQGRNVMELEKAKAFNAAKIVVNTFQGEVFGVNQRFFEIAGCGGFQICEHRDIIQEFFKIGEEIITFYTIGDLIEKIGYYLAHPEERKKIADAAYVRAHKEHTFEKRLEKMLEIISNI
ncbi:MAG: glycosyltransferase [Nanoarchaeota archaeon]|nr:glycosyltransferase [Nanoarchaeota archaeon]